MTVALDLLARAHGIFSQGWETDRYSAYDRVLDARVHPDCLGAACVAHARRKFDELAKAGASPIAEQAIRHWARIFEIEGQLAGLDDTRRQALRQTLARPLWDQLRGWLELERRLLADAGPTAGAIDYTLNHRTVLTHHLDDGAVAIDNNHLERWIKPWAYLRDVLQRLPTQLNSRIDELLPHRWMPTTTTG